MPSLVLQVLPLALGAAVSPTVLMVELLVLSGPRSPKARAWAYVTGALAVLVLAVALFLTVLSRTSAGPHAPSDPVRVVDGAAAVLLVVLGVRSLLPRRTPGERRGSAVADRLATATTPFFLGVGVVMMLTNFSTLVLLAPACHLIATSTDPDSVRAAAITVLVGVVALPILVPVLSVTLLGRRSDAWLARLNTWVSGHSRQLNAGICFALAALLAWKAIG